MKTRFIVWFAWKNLWAHKLRSTLTIGGVSISIAAIVFLVSIGYGLEYVVTSQVANFKAFTVVDINPANNNTGKLDQAAIDKISKVDHVASISEIANLAGRVKLTSQESTTETVIMAANPSYLKLNETQLAHGKMYPLNSKDSVMINTALANLLGYSADPNKAVGQNLSLDMIVSTDLAGSDSDDKPSTKTITPLKIVGITTDAQSPIIFISLDLARANGVVEDSSLKVQLDDAKNADTARKTIESLGYPTTYIGDTVAQISQVFSLLRLILGAFGLIALIVAALGTFNTLTISLMERIREVGLMKTLGIRRSGVFKIFIVESITIGVAGGLFGIALASGVGWVLNNLVRTMAEQSGADTVTIYFSPPSFVMIVAIGSVVVGFFTGFYPALRAIRTSALNALRYE